MRCLAQVAVAAVPAVYEPAVSEAQRLNKGNDPLAVATRSGAAMHVKRPLVADRRALARQAVAMRS
jgi:hypothetical protein